MKKLKNIFLGIIVIFAVMSLASCGGGVTIDQGFVGKKLTPSGFEEEVLSPGRYSCAFRNRMILIETKEEKVKEQMEILCSDRLNLTFSVVILIETKQDLSSDEFNQLILRKGTDMKEIQLETYMNGKGTGRYLPFEELYKTYLKPRIRPIARAVVSPYETVKAVEARGEIEQEILGKLQEIYQGGLFRIKGVYIENMDYPSLITQANEDIKTLKIGIDTEKSRQKKLMEKFANDIILAQKMKERRIKEGQAAAAYIRSMNRKLTMNYLELKEAEVEKILIDLITANDDVIISLKEK